MAERTPFGEQPFRFAAPGREGCGARLVFLALLFSCASLAICPPAGARVEGAQSADRWVTLVARECDSYAEVHANLAREENVESLQDLGDDSLYEAGESIDPRTEVAGQPGCRPLVGWRFTFGAGISRGVEGPWGSLSVVTDPDGGQQPITKGSVPARDFEGHPVSGAKIDGAVTIGLDHQQVERAVANDLWLQGGTPDDPVLYGDPQFAGRLGFAALRCAIDGHEGDNVETIQFPSGTRAMYCYAYYVAAPPPAGTIVIRKQVTGPPSPQTFDFTGNLSPNRGGAFQLSASEASPGSTEFARAATAPGEEPWRAVEVRSEGWALTDISCASGSSPTATDLAQRSAEITLVGGDTVTCTFANRLEPPAGSLVLRKVTENGTGTFPLRIEDEGGDIVAHPALTTHAPGGLGAVRVIKLDPGRYRLSERPPVTRDGVWQPASVSCEGERRPVGSRVTVKVDAGHGAICTFTNRLRRPGLIEIGAVTLGGLSSGGYVVTRAGDPTVQRRQLATTKRQGATALAHGQSTHDLPFGRYVIQETALTAAQRQVWSLVAVVCNGRLKPFEQGRVTVRISRATPEQRCRFVNLRQRQPPPPGPTPAPGPAPGPTPAPVPVPVPGGPTPDLAVEKRLLRVGGGQRPVLTFGLEVANRSAVIANRAVAVDRLAAGTAFVDASASQGRCFTRGARLLVCAFGELAPRERARAEVRVRRVDPRGGVNVAVVGSSSPEADLGDNLAKVRIAPIEPPPAPPPPGATCSGVAPVAHASC